MASFFEKKIKKQTSKRSKQIYSVLSKFTSKISYRSTLLQKNKLASRQLDRVEYCITNTVFKRWNGDKKNSKTHNFMWNVFFRNVFKLETDNCLVFNADDYFTENSARSRNPCFHQPSSYFHKSVTLWQKYGRSKNRYKISWRYELFFNSYRPLPYHHHENFGKSTTRFSQTFIKTLIILRVNKHFCGNFCTSELFNNCFPFSIKILVKYNIVLPVVN